ncbi:MAG: MFS transporter [Anaerolineae bacterium]|nr:MFS transporter [Anaerolineae bacterium]
MKISQIADTVRYRSRSADIFVTRGAPAKYIKGMRTFWIYGILIAISDAFVSSYVSLYVLALGATGLQVGLLSSLSSLMAMLSPIPGAQWAARWGKRKPVVVIAFSLQRLMLLGALSVPFFLPDAATVPVVMGLMALWSGMLNLGLPAWSSLSGDLVPIDRRGRYFSSRKTVMALCSLLFVPLAGQVIEWAGEPQGYQIAFSIAILMAAIALTYYATIPEPAMGDARKQVKDRATFWRVLVENPTFLRFTLFSMVFNFAWQIGGPYFGVYQVQVLGATPKIVGILSMASALTRMIGQQVWGRVIDKQGSRWTLIVCLLIIPVLPFFWFPMTNAWHVLFVTIPSGFLWAGHELANFNLQLELSTSKSRTQAIASYTTLIGLANILGPLVGGQIIEMLSYKWDFAISGIGRLIGALLLLMLLKPFKQKTFSNS